MNKLITIAVDAMGGDNAPKKIIDGLELHHKKSKSVFYKLFGDKNIIDPIIKNKSIDKDIIEVIVVLPVPCPPATPIINGFFLFIFFEIQKHKGIK